MVQTTLDGKEAKPVKISKAEEMASKQREISVAAFFEKNRHLLGFDNPRKALLTTVKEAVDNSLDACEEAEILPEIIQGDRGDNILCIRVLLSKATAAQHAILLAIRSQENQRIGSSRFSGENLC